MRLRILLVPVALVLTSLASGTALADTTPPTFPVGPNQYFIGVVNGKTTGATIYAACPGPATERLGHPVSGQTLSVSKVSAPTDTTIGYTGSLATSIAATPVTSSTTNDPVIFSEYFVARALPTTWTVPCDGDGRIAFIPLPGSSTARTAYVTVHYVNIAAGPAL